jgi:hypothetical protein
MLLITSYDKLAGYAAAEDERMTNSTYPFWDGLHRRCQTEKKGVLR